MKAERFGGIAYSQDVFSLGFPFGIVLPGGGANARFPIGIVKKGILAAFWNENGVRISLFDGLNNPGFSGGPIVYRDGSHYLVTAVVSGYITDTMPTTVCRTLNPGEQPPPESDKWRTRTIDGHVMMDEQGRPCVLDDAKALGPVNTGLIIAPNIQNALDVIRAHPIGLW